MDSETLEWLRDGIVPEESGQLFSGIIDLQDMLLGQSSLPLEETSVPYLPPASPVQLCIQDLGNNTHRSGDWKENQYHTIYLEVDNSCLPILIDNEVWCKGNNKSEQSQSTDDVKTVLHVYLTSDTNNKLTPNCRKSNCRSVKARTCVQINADSQVLYSSSSKIKARILCIPFHRGVDDTSFYMHFELTTRGSNGSCVIASQTLDLGKPKANRSPNRKKKQDFHSPPTVIVLILVVQCTFRTTWRVFQH